MQGQTGAGDAGLVASCACVAVGESTAIRPIKAGPKILLLLPHTLTSPPPTSHCLQVETVLARADSSFEFDAFELNKVSRRVDRKGGAEGCRVGPML